MCMLTCSKDHKKTLEIKIIMAKQRSSKKINGVVKLKVVVKMLQKSLQLKKNRNVPEDVKEGHVAVVAMDGHDQPKRFIIPLTYLTHPSLLKLLEEAAEEYGFDREGALAVPCRPSELETILSQSQSQGSCSIIQSF